MIGRLRAGAKFFTLGLLIGLLFAPRSGEKTRRLIANLAVGAVAGTRNDR